MGWLLAAQLLGPAAPGLVAHSRNKGRCPWHWGGGGLPNLVKTGGEVVGKES
jgi:hypothetical protein